MLAFCVDYMWFPLSYPSTSRFRHLTSSEVFSLFCFTVLRAYATVRLSNTSLIRSSSKKTPWLFVERNTSGCLNSRVYKLLIVWCRNRAMSDVQVFFYAEEVLRQLGVVLCLSCVGNILLGRIRKIVC